MLLAWICNTHTIKFEFSSLFLHTNLSLDRHISYYPSIYMIAQYLHYSCNLLASINLTLVSWNSISLYTCQSAYQWALSSKSSLFTSLYIKSSLFILSHLICVHLFTSIFLTQNLPIICTHTTVRYPFTYCYMQLPCISITKWVLYPLIYFHPSL